MGDWKYKERDRLSKPADCGLMISYTLMPDRLVIHLLGVIPLHVIKLRDVSYLRLATRDEVPYGFYLRNMQHFRPKRAAHCPVYLLKTRKKSKRVYLKLRGGAHFRLRSAIGFHRRVAALAAPPHQQPADDPPAATGT